MKKYFLYFLGGMVGGIIMLFSIVSPVLASWGVTRMHDINVSKFFGIDKLQETGTQIAPGTTEGSLPGMIGAIIAVLLGFLGIVFLILMLYAGYNWMTAMGDAEKVTKAKDTMIAAAIGIVIIVGAYAVSMFVLSKLMGVVG